MTATAAKPRRKIVSCALPAALAMSSPAVRMVAVQVWVYPARFADTPGPDANGDWQESGHSVYPVLAIVAQQEHRYNRFADGDKPPEKAPTHEAMEALGWYYEGTDLIDVDAIVFSDEYRGLCLASFALSASNVVYRLVVCPWPAEEDEARLAPVVAELRAEARAKVAAERKPQPAAS